jgi:two-component system OmpR family sensor kinase
MNWLRRSRYLLPLTLGLLGVLLLARVLLANTFVLVPEDVDAIFLVLLLGIAMTIAIHTIVRISMNHLRLRTVQHVRNETLAEHRRFLSRLDHELKNPLTALRAGVKTLGLTMLDAQQQQIVEAMETETQRLSRLVSDLRKLSELETESIKLQPVVLDNFVANILQLEQERFEAGQRTLTSRVRAETERWMMDEDLVALAVHNLLDNAYKYTHPGDHVEVEVDAQHELILRVSDTGIGIPPEALPHVWEELYRVQQMSKIGGSGTGLALVKAIVERHGGAVDVVSEVGQGTTVTLRLPPV